MMRADTLRSTLQGLVAGITALALVACGSAARPADTLVLASGSDLESANPVVTVHPMSRQVQRHLLFVPLVHLDSTLQPVPALARAWTWADSGRTLRFALRTDVRWHDGVPTTAHDVVFTFDAVRDPETGSPRASDLRDLTALFAPDDSTVIVQFRAPPPSLPLVFAELPPVPAHRLQDAPRASWRAHPFATEPVGNGPYRFVSRTPGVRWRFARHDAYPPALGDTPWAREVVVVVVDEPSTKLAGLVSGELDVAGISPSMAGLVEQDPLLALESPPVLFTTLLAFNTMASPFDDVRVRRAVSLAIDRDRLVRAAVAGFGVPSRGVVPPGVVPPGVVPPSVVPPGVVPPGVVPPGVFPAASDETNGHAPPTTDTAQAAALLDAAGWARGADGLRRRGGQPLTVTLLTAGSGELAVEQLLQDDLRRLGIALTIRTAELATFLSTVRASEKTFDVAYTGVPGDLALGHVRALLHSTQRGGALAYTGIADSALDVALDRAAAARDPSARAAAWAAVDARVDLLAPVAVIYHARGVQGRAASLQGVVMDLRGELATITRWWRDSTAGESRATGASSARP
jgi:peptide/nickel transport system substrate-binding protein